MMDFTRYDQRQARPGQAPAQAKTVSIDQGLRSYMLQVFNYMTGALAVTGLIAYFVGSSEAMLTAIFMSPLKWLVMLAPLGFVLVLSFGINRLSASTAQVIFWAYAATMGLSLSTIFMAYTGVSIARTFFICAATFGAVSLYGYTTKRDLSRFGTFLIMGVFGILIASLVNLFLKSSGLDFAISVIGVLVFTGLVAYDTQRIRDLYYVVAGHGEALSKAAVMGALSLYLDFINLFMYMLRFLGERR